MTTLNINAKVKGIVDLTVIRNAGLDTERREDYRFNNMLLDRFFATGSVSMRYAAIGTDTTVSGSDTSIGTTISTVKEITLAEPMADLTTVGNTTTILSYSTFEFGVGEVVGNASCIGIGVGSPLSGGNLYIKTLIRDTEGSPTTITVGATDQVILKHTLVHTVEKETETTVEIDGTTHTLKFYASRIGVSGSSSFGMTLNSIAPFSGYSAAFGTLYIPSIVISEGITPPLVTEVNTNIPLTGAYAYEEATVGTITNMSGSTATTMTATIGGSTNLTGEADIGFIGWCHSTSASTRTYGGFTITPALPKTSVIAYKITISLIISRA